MAYEVTATRRRPQKFEDLVGQEFVVATLQKSISAGKIAHAYLFSGPRGCGKTSSARILAKALNCESGPSATPCGECDSCRAITRGSSLDVIEIDGASNTSVNDVRQIKDEVQFPPNSSKYKIYIIDEVHMLSTSAFNALLKTIEEPPPYVIFIFATTELHKVPATIKSRCQQFNFRLVSVEQLKAVLSDAASESGLAAEDEALFWVAREATGSVRDAYTLFDQVAAFSDGEITFAKIRDKLGLVGVDRINPLMEECVSGNADSALSLLDSIIFGGVSVEQFVTDLADYFRSLLLLQSGITRDSLLGHDPERFSAVVRESWDRIKTERALSLMLQLYRDIRYSMDPRYELELAVSRLCWLSSYVSPVELKNSLERARGLLVSGGSGPFDGADRASRFSGSESVRETKEQAAVQIPSSSGRDAPSREEKTAALAPAGAAGDSDDPDAFLENPFAALKQRFGVRTEQKPAEVPAQNADTASRGQVWEQPEHSPVRDSSAEPPDVFPSRNPAGDQPEQAPERNSASGQEDEAPKTNASVSFADLQAALVEEFRASKNMIATGIEQAFDWLESGEGISFAVEKPFVHNFLEQEHKNIADAAFRLLGKKGSLTIRLDQTRGGTARSESENKIPASVEMIRHVFRGTIMGETK
ncbi:DNA polymerase III subunit gamma/tau [Treponema zuelzerae]|uniref:DNA polymerase III subunit gamma/tau n=1 Tax=Teretinema zuelzerae TaxID=156 RepID=A0AAE3JJ98_9SPIR|nr:DNA polymerase III subunit gamma/tau [Teretinema zuelzerae]MCD1656157.1 DNA polymerase III subunit gamma/tau [Teretinema zuelzerae]